VPACLVRAESALKKGEMRELLSPQLTSDDQEMAPRLEPKLRVVEVIPNEAAKASLLRIFKNMRVPPRSVLHHAYEADADIDLEAHEDQSWWETTEGGQLPVCHLLVQAIRRGRYVCGLILPGTN